ncbi:MAG TPA: hypothetical protein VL966_12095 [Alphaproteobacteria bacterium]|nr:hypothetical protein [Alphaproteobacteria bacterium]
MMDLVIARALHVLAVVIWIGGVAMATTVVLPAARRGDLGPDRLKAFQAIERRFVWQARTAVVIVGLTGLYMVAQLDLWSRFQSLDFWWMHAMVCVWLLFAFFLFVAEPLIVHRYLHKWAASAPDVALARMHRAHWVLLVLVLITVFGAVAGSHGWSIF